MDNINYDPNIIPVLDTSYDIHNQSKVVDGEIAEKQEPVGGRFEEAEELTSNLRISEQSPVIPEPITRHITNQSNAIDTVKKWGGISVACFSIFLLIFSWNDHSRYHPEFFKLLESKKNLREISLNLHPNSILLCIVGQ